MHVAMRLKAYWGWSLAGMAVLALLAWGGLASRPHVPGYRGKDLYEWSAELRKVEQNYSDPERWKKTEAASAAIRAMGTNALPYVMADLKAHNTVIDEAALWLSKKAPFLKLKTRKVEDRWVRGIAAMKALGPMAKPCLPELVTLTKQRTGYMESALVAVGPDALPAITNLLSTSKFPQSGNLIGALGNAVSAGDIKPEEAAVALPYIVKVFQSTDRHGAWYAASTMGAIHQQPDVCVPLLISGRNDPNTAVREACTRALGEFGDEAAGGQAAQMAAEFDHANPQTRLSICGALAKFKSQAAIGVPVLLKGLQDSDESVRTWSAMGLGQLNAMPEQAVPALTQALEDRSPGVRMMAAQALGQFGRRATNAIPKLEEKHDDPDANVRAVAGGALSRIKGN